MPLHKIKNCPHYSQVIPCRMGDIGHCDSTRIHLSLEEKAFVEDRYHNCLCLNCLKDLKNKYVLFKEKYFS